MKPKSIDCKDLLEVDPILVDRVRIAIMAALSVQKDEVEFLELLDKLEVTKGNLSAHLRKLEETGLIKITKKFVGRKPKTTVKSTKKGLKMFNDYLKTLSELIK